MINSISWFVLLILVIVCYIDVRTALVYQTFKPTWKVRLKMTILFSSNSGFYQSNNIRRENHAISELLGILIQKIDKLTTHYYIAKDQKRKVVRSRIQRNPQRSMGKMALELKISRELVRTIVKRDLGLFLKKEEVSLYFGKN